MKEDMEISGSEIINTQLPNIRFTVPEYSEWVCYLFGGNATNGITFRPIKGKEPNRFVRYMMKVCFACTWEKRSANF